MNTFYEDINQDLNEAITPPRNEIISRH